MNRGVIGLIATLLVVMGAQAQGANDQGCRESLESEAARNGTTVNDYTDYRSIASDDRLNWYYFTKPNNKVYPWAIKAVFTVTPYKHGKEVHAAITTCVPKNAPQPTPAEWKRAVRWGDRVMAITERELLKPAGPKRP